MSVFSTITWAEAKSQGLRKYFTGKPCKNGHISELHISGGCIECRKQAYKRWASSNKERLAELRNSYRRADPEKYLASAQDYKNRNREKVRKKSREWKAKNYQRCIDLAKKWKRLNPGKVSAMNRARKLKMRKAMPSWANIERIKEIYLDASKRGMHVDHIIPLNGELVCGLHVESNLQILTAEENLKKGNRFVIL